MRDIFEIAMSKLSTAHRMRRLSSRAISLTFALGLSAGPAMANPELVAGWEGSDTNDYAFVSPMFSIPMSTSGDVVIKPTANYLRYETRDASGTTSVKAPGGSIGISYRYHDPKLTIDIGPSLEFTSEERTPATGVKTKDSKFGVAVSGNLFYQAARSTTLSVLTNYSQTSHYFWSRGGIKTRVVNRDYQGPVGLSFGPEVTYQTGHGVEQIGGGLMAEVGFDRSATSLQFRGGYSRSSYSNSTNTSSPYFGVGLYHKF